jgi:hypothetical protein
MVISLMDMIGMISFYRSNQMNHSFFASAKSGTLLCSNRTNQARFWPGMLFLTGIKSLNHY